MHHLFCDLSGNRSYLIFFFPLLQTGIRDLLFFLQYIPVQVIAVLHQIPESTHTGQKIFTVCLLL